MKLSKELNELNARINLTRMDLEDDIYEKSAITGHFRGKCIFLTGGAGFLGQIFIEKLLRIGVSAIYLLLRAKKNLSPEERINKICSGPLYERLREKDPNFQNRIRIITGDLEKLQLGISDAEKQILYNEINVVIHAAADVRFNIPLLDLMLSNVRGTRELLEMSKKMQHLETFAYISTAYSHCPRDEIEEKFYDPPMDPDFWLNMLDHCSDKNRETIAVMEHHIMQPWPNSYTYTKALSENIVKNYSKYFPTVVIRPSIVVSTYQDPIPGWTNNITGINGLCVGIGVGFLRHLNVHRHFIIDIICADYVINTTLASIWDAAIKYNSTKQIPAAEVYHATSKGFQLTSGQLVHDSMSLRSSQQLHSVKCIYYPVITFVNYEWQDTLLMLLLQAIPAYLMDLFNTDKRVRLLAITRKVKSMKNVISFFMNKRLYFGNQNVVQVYDRMSTVDKKLFPADSRNFDWLKFVYPYLAGLRIYVLEDPIETWERSKRRLQILKFIHFSLKYSTIVLLIWLIYFFLIRTLMC